MANRLLAETSLLFLPLTSDKPGKEKKMKKKSWLSSSLLLCPSLALSLPGSAGRQMTSGRLITPGWVFSNLFNGSLLKKI